MNGKFMREAIRLSIQMMRRGQGGPFGAVVVRKRLRVTMSCDHRVIDGAIGAGFLQDLRRMIENPLMLVF